MQIPACRDRRNQAKPLGIIGISLIFHIDCTADRSGLVSGLPAPETRPVTPSDGVSPPRNGPGYSPGHSSFHRCRHRSNGRTRSSRDMVDHRPPSPSQGWENVRRIRNGPADRSRRAGIRRNPPTGVDGFRDGMAAAGGTTSPAPGRTGRDQPRMARMSRAATIR